MIDYSIFSKMLEKHIYFRLEQSKIKLTDLVLEELISFALEDSQHKHLYESGSHKKGGDISTDSEGFSIKSSKEDKNKISISSYRLTRFGNNLEDMIKFIDYDKNFDKYLILSRNETEEIVKYSFYVLPSNIFIATDMNWIETKNKNNEISGWHTVNNDNINLKIVKSMSSQLWIEIKTDFIKNYKLFEITKNISELGNKRFIAE